MSLLVQEVDNMKPVNKGMEEQVSGKFTKSDSWLGLEGHRVSKIYEPCVFFAY